MHIDTHRHMGGSIPVQWVWDAIQKNNWNYLAESYQDVYEAMVFTEDEPKQFHRFLTKFKILDEIRWSEELIDSSIAAVCTQLEMEKLDFTWLDFSINKYMAYLKWHKKEVIKFIYDSFNARLPGKVGLILSIKYESLHANQKQYSKLIDDADVASMLFGIDLVGDESQLLPDLHTELLRYWSGSGKVIRAHVAEFGPSSNIAVVAPYVTNIAHGIKIIQDQDLTARCKDSNISFDLGLTSNYYTGVVTGQHPILDMANAGLCITLGSDDPVICRTDLDSEYSLAEQNGLSAIQIEQIRQNSIRNTRVVNSCCKTY